MKNKNDISSNEKDEENKIYKQLITAMLCDAYKIPPPMPDELFQARMEQLEKKDKERER